MSRCGALCRSLPPSALYFSIVFAPALLQAQASPPPTDAAARVEAAAPAAATAPVPADPSAATPTNPPLRSVIGDASPVEARREAMPFVLRAFVGAGFAGFKDRSSVDDQNHVYSETAAAVAAGVLLVQEPYGSLGVSAEVLLAHSFESAVEARAAGNLVGAGLALSAYFSRLEVGLGGYLVSRSQEARDLKLTESHVNGGVGASFYWSWPSAQRLSWGLGVKVLMLPTSSYEDADGQKHVHFSDGLGTVGICAAWR